MKIWAKKLELDAQSMPYVAKTTKFSVFLQDVTIDNRANLMAAKLLSQFYQGLMEKIWQHADPEEFATLLSPGS